MPQKSPQKDAPVDGLLGQLFAMLLKRDEPAPPVYVAPPEPVVERSLSTPPYGAVVAASPNRKQYESWAQGLSVASPNGTVQLQVRCDFFTVYARSIDAVQGDGFWILPGSTPPPVPNVVDPNPTRTPLWCGYNDTVYIHGAEQQVSFTLQGTHDLDVIVVGCTNVTAPH